MNTLNQRAKEEIKQDEDIIILSIVSAFIATCGIILSDNFILLASMLVSPFFDPIISLIVFTKAQEWKSVIKGLKTLLLIILLSLSTSALTTFALSWKYNISNVIYNPNIRLEYFIIAITLGIVGMLLWLWPKMPNTSAGIAIAISLMPPLANISRNAILLNWDKVLSSSTAFCMNIIGILIGGMIVIFVRKTIKISTN